MLCKGKCSVSGDSCHGGDGYYCCEYSRPRLSGEPCSNLGSETQFIDISSGSKASGLLQALSSVDDRQWFVLLGLRAFVSSQHRGYKMLAQMFTMPSYLQTCERRPLQAVLDDADFSGVTLIWSSLQGAVYGAHWEGVGCLNECVLGKVLALARQAWISIWSAAFPSSSSPCHSAVAVVSLHPFENRGFPSWWQSILCWSSLPLAVLQGTQQFLFIWFSFCLVNLVFCLFCFVRFFFSPKFSCLNPLDFLSVYFASLLHSIAKSCLF